MSPVRRLFGVSLVLVTALVTGCGAPAGASTPPGQPPAAAESPAGPNDVAADLPAPAAYPSDDADSRAAAEAAAGDTMTAFVQVDLGAEDWLAGLSPHLSPAARSAYVGTDPLQVPARQVTGPARYEGSTSAYLATVVVPTDVGEYWLLLVREGQGAPWLTETLTPPGDLP